MLNEDEEEVGQGDSVKTLVTKQLYCQNQCKSIVRESQSIICYLIQHET